MVHQPTVRTSYYVYAITQYDLRTSNGRSDFRVSTSSFRAPTSTFNLQVLTSESSFRVLSCIHWSKICIMALVYNSEVGHRKSKQESQSSEAGLQNLEVERLLDFSYIISCTNITYSLFLFRLMWQVTDVLGGIRVIYFKINNKCGNIFFC